VWQGVGILSGEGNANVHDMPGLFTEEILGKRREINSVRKDEKAPQGSKLARRFNNA
jgi:hypothetical protein